MYVPPGFTHPAAVGELAAIIAAAIAGGVESAFVVAFAPPELPATSVAVTGTVKAPSASEPSATVDAPLYVYVTPLTVQPLAQRGRASAAVPAVRALTSAVTVATPLAGAPPSVAFA